MIGSQIVGSKTFRGWGKYFTKRFEAALANIFMASTQLEFMISIAGVLIFAGLTAWDTQRIKSMYMVGDNADVAAKKSIFGALTLYLDFINMFLFILRLFGNRE